MFSSYRLSALVNYNDDARRHHHCQVTAEPVTKIDSEQAQSDINNFENELAECIVKNKTTKGIVEQGKKYCFLNVIVGLSK